MGKLDAALAWAARGFPVFPLVPNGKEPAFDETWYETATTDPDVIRAIWTDPVLRVERDYNIGCDCSNYVVADLDVKNGKDGYNQYVQLGGTFDTLAVQTPTGGLHLYFEGPPSANAKLAPDVDLRSHHGYVVAPGSTIDGAAYKIVTDKPPQWVPLAIDRMIVPPYQRREGAISALDSPASIQAAIRYLESAPVAVEGQRGDETTFVTAARLVRELALSPETAISLLQDHWNPRCQPPWSLDELAQKVENAVAYGSAELGRLDPSVVFRTAADLEPPPSVFAQRALTWGNALDVDKIAPRPWIVDRLLMLHEMTLLLAPGSAGKSVVSLAIAAHLAVGKDFGQYKTRIQCKTIVYNGEDDKAEQSRRLYAVCQSYGLDYSAVKQKVMLLSSDDIDLRLVTAPGRSPVVNEEMVRQYVELASDPEVGLSIFDPLIDVHEVDEADNPQMNAVMRVMKRVAREGNVASLILHHVAKGGNARQEDRIGNMDIARGASGIVNKARVAFTLLNASKTDAEEYGMQDHERHKWARLDDAKMNITLANDTATWFRREGVKLPNGDIVGVLRHAELTKSTDHIRLRIAEAIMATMAANGAGSMTMVQAIATIKVNEPLWANKTDADIRQRLEGMFSGLVEIRGQKLQAVRQEGSKGGAILVMS